MKELKATFRGRPRGRLGTERLGTGRVRGRPRGRLSLMRSGIGRVGGRPRRFGCTQGCGAIRYHNSSVMLHT